MNKRYSDGEKKNDIENTNQANNNSCDGTLRCLQMPDSIARNLLENKNKHIFDKQITFREKDHKYWINGNCTDIVSATTYIHGFFSKFDADKIIGFILKSKKWSSDPNYKYFRMSKKQIMHSWEENRDTAAQQGTKLHADIEYHYNGLDSLIRNDSYEYNVLFKQFEKEHSDLVMFRTEHMIFSKVLRITGSIDGIAINTDGTINLIDWKRTKEIKFKSYGNKKGKEPFDHLPDCNYVHYALQLNLYRAILETFYGMIVREMFLVILHPNQEKYIKIKIPRMQTEAHLLFEFRRQFLIKIGVLNNVDEKEHYYFKTLQDLYYDDNTPIFPQYCKQ
jgi:CRISPR/Cas system-associated exonuclease Cas4 (RecB family)